MPLIRHNEKIKNGFKILFWISTHTIILCVELRDPFSNLTIIHLMLPPLWNPPVFLSIIRNRTHPYECMYRMWLSKSLSLFVSQEYGKLTLTKFKDNNNNDGREYG